MNVNTLFPFFGLVFSTTAVFAEDLQPTTLTVGVNYSVDFQSYKGQRTYQSVLPTVFFDNDKFYAEGDEAGIYLLNNDKNQLRLNAYYDGSSYDPTGELKGLDQRKWSVMAGGSYMRITPYGGLKAQLGTDVLSRSKGTVGTVSYVAELKHDQWSFYPELGLQWNDAKYNQYYYGVSDKESKRTHIQAYQAKQSISPFASLAANYTFSKHWSAFSTLEVNYLSSEQANSPMIAHRTEVIPSIGINYSF